MIIIITIKSQLKRTWRKMLKEKDSDYHTNPPHGQFERATKKDWLRKGVLMKETEGLINSCPGSDVKKQ